MGGGAVVVAVAFSLFAASIVVGWWLRRAPRFRSIPRPTPWMVADAAVLAKQERVTLTPAARKLVDRAVARGAAVPDSALAVAAYRAARAESAAERERLHVFPRGLFFPACILFLLFAPGLVNGEGRVFGESGVVDAVFVLLPGCVCVTEALRSPRSLRRYEQAEELNSDLMVEVEMAPPTKRGRWSRHPAEGTRLSATAASSMAAGEG